MAQFTCPGCSAVAEEGSEFCDHCGAPLARPLECPACQAGNRPEAAFCAHCGAALTAAKAAVASAAATAAPAPIGPVPPAAMAVPTASLVSEPEAPSAAVPPSARQPAASARPSQPKPKPKPARPAGAAPRRRTAAIAVAAVLVLGVAAAAGYFLLTGGDGEEKAGLDFARPAPIDRAFVADLQKLADTLPKPSGETDRDQVRSLLGDPDTFELAFEPASAESDRLVRRETWFYFDMLSAFEFVDGDLIANLPIDDVSGLVVLPRQYNPGQFDRETRIDDVKKLLVQPGAASQTSLPEALGAEVTALAGEQLLVAFDEDGLLVYAQTFILRPGGAE